MRVLAATLGCLACLAPAAASADRRSTEFPPGWNKVAMTPPRGWRSWNAWGARVSQTNMEASIDALAAKLWTVDGKANMSLFDAGYTSAGIDEGWEACGKGVNKTQHAANGDPVINTKFPDMGGLVKYGHDKGFKMGWYENGCACGERKALDINYEGDVKLLHTFGFDGVKLDGCGAQRNMTLYAALMEATEKSYLIENCHWGKCNEGDDSSCPTETWCPFNWYRTSGDINNSPMSWYRNLQTTIAFQDPLKPLSVPGCWAYPDMLEVGRIMVGGKMDYGWNRAHFGAWCVVSAPLILGMDVTQYEKVAAVADIITNSEAIDINQQWAGHPGALVWSGAGGAMGYPAARKCNPSNKALKQSGWKLAPLPADAAGGKVSLVGPGGGCLRVQGAGYQGGRGGLVLVTCNATDPEQAFTYNPTTFELQQFPKGNCVDVHSSGPIVWMYGCSTSSKNDQLHFDAKAGTITVDSLCIGAEADDPSGATFESSLQAWAKPLNATSGMALLLINPNPSPEAFAMPLASLPLWHGRNLTGSGFSVHDVWERKSGPPIAKGTATIKMTVPGMDSVFLRLLPA